MGGAPRGGEEHLDDVMDLSHVPRAHHQEGDHGRDAVVTPLRVLGYGGIRIWKVWDMEVWDMEGVGYGGMGYGRCGIWRYGIWKV